MIHGPILVVLHSQLPEGATVANYVEMIGLLKDKDGKAIGVKCHDNLTQKEFDVHAKSIIFCSVVPSQMNFAKSKTQIANPLWPLPLALISSCRDIIAREG